MSAERARNDRYAPKRGPLRVDVSLWNCWRKPRIEHYADGTTAVFFGIGKVAWWR